MVKEREELYLYSPLEFHGLFWGDLYLTNHEDLHHAMHCSERL
jgi:hypothetical protein